MKMVRYLLCFLLLILSVGCRTSGPSRQESEKAYAIRAVFIDVPSTLLEELNLSWMLNSSRVVNTTEYEDAIKKLFASHKTRTTECPVVYVNAGERNKIDKQRPVKYPTAYEEDGRPTSYTNTGVGLLIEIGLKSVTNGLAQFSYHIEDVDNPIWTTYSHKTGKSFLKLKQPVFRSRSIWSSSEITIPLNSWLIMGGLIMESKDGTKRNMIAVIQVQENKKPQPINSPYSSPSVGLYR